MNSTTKTNTRKGKSRRQSKPRGTAKEAVETSTPGIPVTKIELKAPEARSNQTFAPQVNESERELVKIIKRVLQSLASLKLSVALFAMAFFVVFAGTVAQIDKGIWTVVRDYFRTPISWIELGIFFPRAWEVPGGFYFPGGWLIGGVLLVNLLCAHAVRFKVKAKGGRLLIGSLVLATGALLTWLVIVSAFGHDGSGETLTPYWRVTMQLLRGGLAALVLLAGCVLLFYKRAGIVLIHSGIVLMMLSELVTGLYAEESIIRLREGDKASFARDVRSVELAIVDPSGPNADWTVVVPEPRLRKENFVHHEDLPVDVMVRQFMKNSVLVDVSPEDPPSTNRATVGAGLMTRAKEIPEVSGVDMEQKADMPSAYVTLKKKGGEQVLGTYLVSAGLRRQPVVIGKSTYEMSLRYTRRYLRSKDSENCYWLHLIDFRHDKYVGTEKPKNFSSLVRLVDPDRNVDRQVKIWMNNPLRYAGEVFYQSSFERNDDKVTILQVVRNQGWMVPYVSCMIVAIGLLWHFGTNLLRFLRRRLAS